MLAASKEKHHNGALWVKPVQFARTSRKLTEWTWKDEQEDRIQTEGAKSIGL